MSVLTIRVKAKLLLLFKSYLYFSSKNLTDENAISDHGISFTLNILTSEVSLLPK